jgi:predicted TIM-barrel fold metal-dependent hydrolase
MTEGIEDLLCFSSDYPHWTGDSPTFVAKLLPKSWHRKVFCDNACDFFGWERPDSVATLEPVEPAVAG